MSLVAAIGLAVVVIAGLSIVIYTMMVGISPMPSSRKALRAVVDALPSEIDGIIYELGVGWGGMMFALARRYPEQAIVGYELSPVPYLFCRLRLLLTPLSNIRLYRRNFFEEPIGDAGLIVCYLYPGAMSRLAEKFDGELPPGAWVVTHTFAVPEWSPESVTDIGDLYHSKVYRYHR